MEKGTSNDAKHSQRKLLPKHLLYLQDAVRDGLRAVKNALEDGCVVPGAGAYEVAVNLAITKGLEKIKGKARLGMQAYGEGMLVIPKVLSQNAGYDPQDVIVTLVQEAGETGGKVITRKLIYRSLLYDCIIGECDKLSWTIRYSLGIFLQYQVPVGVDCGSGEAINPVDQGIYDNYRVKKQMIHSCTVIACNLLLVDEIMRAGLSSLKG